MYQPEFVHDERTMKWNLRFMRKAEDAAMDSKDPSTKVGALIVSENGNILSTGYNGFPRKVRDLDERLNDRTIKYPLTVHAELNALSNCLTEGISTKGSILICTHLPCATCCGVLLQAQVEKWVIKKPTEEFKKRWGEEYKFTMMMIKDAGINPIIVE